ncbi:hypothetical protein [Acidovorax sp. SUPP2825]|uniref:hypothetical protein n=1 Tax=Acidovorax sp. SUPP2825 TaxID=2920879 RepID=UPI0023DE3817|nr:hypothetical protein [Acidovorax sp. SUPP2825]GKS93213.1 hypothetical protein AVAK2825_01780 [Acidovorax sp. SUPP2825]
MQTKQNLVEVSADLEHRLELLRQHYGLPTTTAVIELLISRQIERSVYEMTGKRPGPKLAIDNTKDEHDADRPQQLSGAGESQQGVRPSGRAR